MQEIDDGKEKDQGQIIDDQHLQLQFPAGESQIDVEENGVAVLELLFQIVGEGADDGFKDKGIYQE
jgi:hypothetical protein